MSIHKSAASTLFLFFICNLILFGGTFSSHARSQAPIIGAQISVLTTQDRRERRHFFAQLRSSGFNTIIVRVFQNRSDRFHHFKKVSSSRPQEGVYFNTSLVPVIDNLLPGICQDAHGEGLRVFAWMTTLHANYDHKPLPKVYHYNLQNHSCQPMAVLDPTADENRKFLTALYRDLAANPIDGIMFQDDLMLRHTEGFHPRKNEKGFYPQPASLYKYAVDKKKILGYKPAFWNWSNKSKIIINIISFFFSKSKIV